MFEQFAQLIKQYTPIDSHELDFIQKTIPVVHYPKNEIILNEGTIADTIYFVLKGCVRLFYQIEGTDKTAFFYTEGKFLCAGESYTYNIPAQENFQALEDTSLLLFNKQNLDLLMQRSPKYELIARIAVENELITSQQIIASFVTKSPEERYIELITNNKELFQRVPQQYIATFLGISPETLSRIKKRVFKKEVGFRS